MPINVKLFFAAIIGLVASLLTLLPRTANEKIIVSTMFIVAMLTAGRRATLIVLFLVLRPCLDLIAEQQVAGIWNSASLATIFFILTAGQALLRKESIAKIAANRLILDANRVFLAFLVLSLISFVNSRDLLTSFSDWLRLVSIIVMFNYAFLYFSESRAFAKLFIAILLSGVVPLALGMYQYLFYKGNLYTPGFNRIYGTFLHPNVLAEYLVILFVAVLYFLKEHRSGKSLQLVLYSFLAIALFEIFHTYTRGAWIALALSLFVISITYRKHQKIIYFVLILTVMLVIFPAIQKRFMDIRAHNPELMSSWEWRLMVWNDTKKEISKHAVIGHGLGMYQKGFTFMAHNDYLRLAYETGISGLIIYLLFLATILGCSIRKIVHEKNKYAKNRYVAISGLMVAFLVMGAADNLVRSTVVLLYLFCVIGALVGYHPDISHEKS
ncbi:MAG: O-antigen ligase family protein [Candidatus Omnitrophota bacterium]|jgi:O-antigen ligase